MENLKNIAPVEDFNWEAYENGESFAGASHEDLEKAYDSTLNKVNDRLICNRCSQQLHACSLRLRFRQLPHGR